MTKKLEQAAQALLAHWDTPSWKYLKPTGDLMADLREALVEQDKPLYRKVLREMLDAHEQAEQEPFQVGFLIDGIVHIDDDYKTGVWPLYAAPVRTKDLTDDEIGELIMPVKPIMEFARAVIAADRSKNGII